MLRGNAGRGEATGEEYAASRGGTGTGAQNDGRRIAPAVEIQSPLGR